MENGLSFAEIQNAAEDPMDGYSVERAMWKHVQFVCLDFPCMPEEWTLDQPQVWQELRELPENPGPETFCVSFMTLGDMDRDTGELLYILNCCATRSGDIRSTGICTGKPTKRILEELLYKSITSPVQGRPKRPIAVLFAHRWGAEMSRECLDLLGDRIDLMGSYETRHAAIVSAANNGTDPDGYNWRS